MLQLAADENFNYNIVRGVLRRKLEADIIRVQDIGLSGADDASVLEWAAQEKSNPIANQRAAQRRK